MEDNKKEKTYSPEEVANAILAKAHDLLKNSTLSKANTSHEIEPGGEPKSDGSEAPEYLANADIEGSGSDSQGRNEAPEQIADADIDTDDKKKRKKKEKYDGAMDVNDDNPEKQEEIDEAQEDYNSEEREIDDDQEEYHEDNEDIPTKKYMGKSEDMDKCGDMKTMEKMSPESAAKKVMGDAELDEMLDKVPAHKRDDVLKKLRQMKKEGKSKEEMGKMCKAAYDMETGEEIGPKEGKKRNEISQRAEKQGKEQGTEAYRKYNKQQIKSYKTRSKRAKEAAANRKAKQKKVAKSEGALQTDGITKVYEFLAKSYHKKVEQATKKPEHWVGHAGKEDKDKMQHIADKKKKKEKLKKMAMKQQPQGPKDPQGIKPQKDQMEPPKGATGMKGY